LTTRETASGTTANSSAAAEHFIDGRIGEFIGLAPEGNRDGRDVKPFSRMVQTIFRQRTALAWTALHTLISTLEASRAHGRPLCDCCVQQAARFNGYIQKIHKIIVATISDARTTLPETIAGLLLPMAAPPGFLLKIKDQAKLTPRIILVARNKFRNLTRGSE